MHAVDIRKPRWSSDDNSMVDVEVKFDELPDFVPCTVSNQDEEEHLKDLWQRVVVGKEAGTIAPFTPRDPLTIPLTASEFEAALVLLGIDRDQIEPAITAAISDSVERARALGGWRRLTSITRDNAIMELLKPAFNVTDADIDAAWAQAASF